MGLRAFIRKTYHAIKTAPKRVTKTLKRIRVLVSILSPRTLPSAVTIGVKAGLGFILIKTAQALKFFSSSEEIGSNQNDMQEFNNYYFFPVNSVNNGLERMGEILVFDSALDAMKILGMFARQQYKIYSINKELSRVEVELKQITEAASQNTLHQADKKNIAERTPKENALIKKQDRLKADLEKASLSAINVENYHEILEYAFLINGIETLPIMYNIVLISVEIPFGCWGEVNLVIQDNYLPNKLSFLVVTKLLFSLAITYYDMNNKFQSIDSRSFGNRPIVGMVSATLLLSNVADLKNEYQQPSAQLNIAPYHTQALWSDDLLYGSMFKGLSGYPEVAKNVYSREYQRAYTHYSSKNRFSNYESQAKLFAEAKILNFQSDGGLCLHARLFLKDVYLGLLPLLELYSMSKFYKNILTAVENGLDIVDSPGILNINSHNKSRILIKNLSHREKATHKLLAQAKLRRSRKPPRQVKVQKSSDSTTLVAYRRAQLQAQAEKSLLEEPSGNLSAGVEFDEHNSNNIETPDVPVKQEKRKKRTEPKPMVFSKLSHGDSKSNAETDSREIETEKEENEILQRKQEILSNYPNCNQEFFRSILNNTARDVSEADILKLAENLKLSVRATTSGHIIHVHKQEAASFHRPHGKPINPGFISDLAKAFKAIDITIDDLDELDEQMSQCACSGRMLLSAFVYAVTTKPKIRNVK